MIESRLQDWDKLPGPVQQQLLTNQEAIRLFVQREAGATTAPDANNSEKRRQKLEEDLVKIKAMKEDDRRLLLERFNKFFELTAEEKKKALSSLSEAERAKIQKTLERYKNLTPEQRARCIRSFEKFSEMSLAERQQFLKNAERWIVMKPEERKAWRDLVEQIELMPPDDDPLRRIRPPGVRSNSSVVKGNTN